MHEERHARLLGAGDEGGGVPLSDAFRVTVTCLWDSGGCPVDVIARAVRKTLSFKEERVKAVWGTWDFFTSELLEELLRADYVQVDGEAWLLTDKTIPEKQLGIQFGPQRIRFTFHDQRGNEVRESIGNALVRTNELLVLLRDSRNDHTALRQAYQVVSGLSELLTAVMINPKQGLAKSKAAWYRDWSKTVSWHSMLDAVDAWNKEFPDDPLTYNSIESGGPFRSAARLLVKDGMMITQPGRRANGRKGGVRYRRAELHLP